MFFALLISSLSFAEPNELLTIDGRKVLLKEDGSWEYSKPYACDKLIQVGYTDKLATTVISKGVLQLKRGAPFEYQINAYPEDSENIRILLYRKKNSFKDQLIHFNFRDQSFFQNLKADLKKIPYKGWAFEITRNYKDPLWMRLVSKKLSNLETKTLQQYEIHEISANQFQNKLACVDMEVHKTIALLPKKPKKTKKKKKKAKKQGAEKTTAKKK